ncbi:MAG: RNA-binding protein [Acidobacteria bacterium]|nr:RNA-binding protein [Acidobacteriota bacterium]
MATRLYVGNLSFSVSEQDLEEIFAQVGTVESSNIVTDRETGRSRGFAFVEMANRADADAAIQKFNDRELKGRSLTVKEAGPRERRRGGLNEAGFRLGDDFGSIHGERSTFDRSRDKSSNLRALMRKKRSRFDTEHTDESIASEAIAKKLPTPDALFDIEVINRYSMLVDKKFGSGLSEEEREELVLLKTLLEKYDTSFYEPIIEQLTAIEESLKVNPQQSTEKK